MPSPPSGEGEIKLRCEPLGTACHKDRYIVPLSPSLSTVAFSASYVCRANFE